MRKNNWKGNPENNYYVKKTKTNHLAHLSKLLVGIGGKANVHAKAAAENLANGGTIESLR